MKVSNCCGRGPANESGICLACREHCDWVDGSEDELQVSGVGRMGDNSKALLVSFNRTPTDEELRTIHDKLKEQA